MTETRKIAIVHYHLRGGGATRVIAHAAAAIEAAGGQAIILSGEAPRAAFDHDVTVVPSLCYDADAEAAGQSPAEPQRIVDDLLAAPGGDVDVWHLHNVSLGKNAALPIAVHHLAERGRRIVLQPHDFAEDGRPGNYRHLAERDALTSLYPVADHVHYATLNRRDQAALIAAGLDADRVHTLPNAIDLAPAASVDTNDLPPQHGPLVLYPTRAIRRKNIGELLLWAAGSRDADRHFATTLAPTSAVDQPAYENWKRLAAALDLPVDFEIGSRSDASFTALLHAAHALITTSIAEGFGLAFLEPFAAGRPLVGRDLPDISADFKADGIDLSSLYTRLDVPLEWIGRDTLRHHITAPLRRTFVDYDRACADADIDAALDAFVVDDQVDFGRLDESLQQTIIEHVHRDRAAAALLQPDRIDPPADGESLDRNRRIIAERYSLDAYRLRLAALYDAVMASTIGAVDVIPPGRVLDQFLDPARFFLLRT